MLAPALKLMRPADVAYNHVKRRIMLNELEPETVLTELGLAREIGASQGTVREALLRLQEEGLVSRSGRRGTVVTRLTADEAQEMLVLRRTIETRGARRAAAAATPALIETLLPIRAAMDDAAAQQDEYGLIEADKDFHLAIFRASGLDALEQILVRCMLHSHRFKLWAPGHRRPLVDTVTRHDVLMDCLRARDGEGLAQALGQHIDTIVLLGDAAPTETTA
ncbi:GntR family transcriptional regulator [Alsobacter metallidurans]|uniref:GntR family transcriptional regulator n=1 Tax=Alsobacter metallidurans TaxID=340221 RepID=A0A917MJ13_9HYPH|nr:GntR family transcriptional regulator [Alsobacter metallidurans]GGH23981.1 GntR family transcriptional regulator [Alsobacter metallidurans]